jgi:hypothetical protein
MIHIDCCIHAIVAKIVDLHMSVSEGLPLCLLPEQADVMLGVVAQIRHAQFTSSNCNQAIRSASVLQHDNGQNQ